MGEKKTFVYCGSWDYEDNYGSGKLARAETQEEGIPLNIFMEPDSDRDLEEGDPCEIEVYGYSHDTKAFPDEAVYYAAGGNFAPRSLIPCGMFPSDPDDERTFTQSPVIMFSGEVHYVEKDPFQRDDGPDYLLAVETYDLNMKLYAACDEEIEEGYIVSGTAWLCGTFTKKS